jgi:GNAT superfamily N-acetyltransferase
MARFDAEVETAFAVYNAAWSANWGFVPMTDAEFRFAARGLKSVIDPATALIAEASGQAVGFALALPDVNPLLKRLRGKLGPWGAVRFALGRRRVRALRVLILGVVEAYRKRGIEMVLIDSLWRRSLQRGYRRPSELSWVLEDNALMRKTIERFGGKVSKRYRIYSKPL